MKQRFNELTHDLCVRAVFDCLDHKWLRNDVLAVIMEYGGVGPDDVHKEINNGNSIWKRMEAVENIAYEVEERVIALLEGTAENLDLDPIAIRARRDGMTQKMRDIACCSVFHQIFGHLAVLGMEPMFKAKLLPNQYASIPGKGQIALKTAIEKGMRKVSMNIRYTRKIDVHHAYGSTKYSVVIEQVKKDIPNAHWIIAVLEAIQKVAIDDHLIIGGYLDAWLFNYIMSYALRYINSLKFTRRGVTRKMATLNVSYMDDIGLGGPRYKDLKSVYNKLKGWLKKNYGLDLKPGGKETVICSYYVERSMYKSGKKARPASLDMGGYAVHHGYTSIRRTIFVRIRRCLIRANREYERTGTVPIYRARSLAAYYGYLKHTNSKGVIRDYNVKKLMQVAKRVIGYHTRQALKNNENYNSKSSLKKGAVLSA